MKDNLLLPNKFKFWGWILLIPTTILGIIESIGHFEGLELKCKVFAIISDYPLTSDNPPFGIIETNIVPTALGILFIVAAIFVGFSQEKKEDEFIFNLRLSSLIWAVWVNYILLFICFLFIYGMPFYNVMLYNMFTVLIIFIIRFNYILYKNSLMAADEK
jgi:hypothetical protein